MISIALLPFKATRTFVRLAGLRGAILFAVGVGIGLLIAPTSGARLRARILERLQPEEPTPIYPAMPESLPRIG